MARKTLRILALVVAIAALVGLVYGDRVSAFFQHDHSQGGAQDKAGKSKPTYTCPMHPEVKSDKPGRCPHCGMNLEPQKPAEQKKKTENKAADSHAGHDMSNLPAPASAASGERKVLYWYDPMHPHYKSNKPGTAPDCGMDLVPMYEDGGAGAEGTVTISTQKQQLMGVRTALVERERLSRTVRTTGQIAADETRVGHVHVKISGFIEDVYVDYVGQAVKQGQPLFTLYSPELVSTQQEYLIARRGASALGAAPFREVASGSQSLLEATRERLKLWDIRDEQIRTLEQTGKVSRTMTFYAPHSGIVMERKAFPHTAVNPDTELYTLSDLSRVWVNADVYEFELPYVRVGQRAEVQLSYYPGKTWKGKVTFVYPTVDSMTRSAKVRLELDNPGLQLKPGMFADVQLKMDYGTQVVVPQEAVLDSGAEQIVFVALDGGRFQPRRINKGAQLEGKVVVLSGLKAGETIVTSGNFLIDSESRLKSAMSGMQH